MTPCCLGSGVKNNTPSMPRQDVSSAIAAARASAGTRRATALAKGKRVRSFIPQRYPTYPTTAGENKRSDSSVQKAPREARQHHLANLPELSNLNSPRHGMGT